MPLTLTLDPDGTLVAEVPHRQGGTHHVRLKPGRAEEALRQILQAQANGELQHTGTSACPTQAELDHRANHATFPDPRCAFCREAIAWAKRRAKAPAGAKPCAVTLAEHGGVEVRRLPPKSPVLRRRKPAPPSLSLEDLDL